MNVKQVGKKMNAKVFDNSIEIITREGKEIFFTSFVYRDYAFELIQKQIDIMNGVVTGGRTSSGNDLDQNNNVNNMIDNRNGEVGIENKMEYSQGLVGEEEL